MESIECAKMTGGFPCLVEPSPNVSQTQPNCGCDQQNITVGIVRVVHLLRRCNQMCKKKLRNSKLIAFACFTVSMRTPCIELQNGMYSKRARPYTYVFSFGSQQKLQVAHDFTFGATLHKIVVKRTVIGKQLRFYFTMFSTSGLVRVATAFQSKQGMPNCIGAIDGSHIYIASPSNTIVAADHRNRNKSFSILLQGVVDSKCCFTSINTGPPGSLHDSAHFKSSELYRKVEEGVMGGFHDNPLSWPAGLPFPPYIVADRGYPLLSGCITPFKMGPTGVPLSREELWFNKKHSSTRMSVERAFGILKARFKEIGTKSSLKLEFLPTVVHSCCVLHNILLASKDRTLDQILADCHLPPMDDNESSPRDEEEAFQPPRPMGLVSEERALLEGHMAKEDLVDYMVRTNNANHIGHAHR